MTRLEALGCQMDAFQYRKVADMDIDGLPVVVEVAFAPQSDEAPSSPDYWRQLVSGDRQPVSHAGRRRLFMGDGLDTLLESQKAGHDEPVVVLVHVARPGIQSRDRGKSSVSLSAKLADIIRTSVIRATAPWCKIRKAEERQERKRHQRQELLSRS